MFLFCISSHQTLISVSFYTILSFFPFCFPFLYTPFFFSIPCFFFGEWNQFISTAYKCFAYIQHNIQNKIHVMKLNKMWLFTICYLICHGYPIWNWNFITGLHFYPSISFSLAHKHFKLCFFFVEFVSCNNFSMVIVCYRSEYLMLVALCFAPKQNQNKCMIWF